MLFPGDLKYLTKVSELKHPVETTTTFSVDLYIAG